MLDSNVQNLNIWKSTYQRSSITRITSGAPRSTTVLARSNVSRLSKPERLAAKSTLRPRSELGAIAPNWGLPPLFLAQFLLNRRANRRTYPLLSAGNRGGGCGLPAFLFATERNSFSANSPARMQH
jgi:hypothetical protein